jgi:hypothetical protein
VDTAENAPEAGLDGSDFRLKVNDNGLILRL